MSHDTACVTRDLSAGCERWDVLSMEIENGQTVSCLKCQRKFGDQALLFRFQMWKSHQMEKRSAVDFVKSTVPQITKGTGLQKQVLLNIENGQSI